MSGNSVSTYPGPAPPQLICGKNRFIPPVAKFRAIDAVSD
jgi:hypothetical protein